MDTATANQFNYSVPLQAQKLFKFGILKNPLISNDIPPEAHEFARSVKFTGSPLPSIPIQWRFAESSASLLALEASIISALLKRKYNQDISSVTINTDHAQLFFMSTLIWTMNPDTDETVTAANSDKLYKYIQNYDFHGQYSSLHRISATNIYKTRDGKFFHLHGSMNPNPTLESIGLPFDAPAQTMEESWKPFSEKMSQIESSEMQVLASEVYKQAGVICESIDSYRASEHGKANEHVGLFEIHSVPDSQSQPPTWWPSTIHTSASRPLAGLKVVDLTRVIAAPAVTKGLAELGASVMRVTSPNLCDYCMLHIDLNWGKWNCSLDLKNEEAREKLRSLIKEADVVVQGYRPGVLDKYGFGQQDIVDMCKERGRGIISVRENCYGWHGPWSQRSGWQQISDGCVGISWAFGKAMGLQNGEPVTPVFPNSDYMTGIAGVCGVICALIRRAEHGGSYKVDIALNYYNQWLANSVGEYPNDVWQDVWKRNGNPIFRSYHNMHYTIPRLMKMIVENSADTLLKKEFFEDRETKALGVIIRSVKPVIHFDNGEVELLYNVGTRGNGWDAPRWPDDLMTEVVQA